MSSENDISAPKVFVVGLSEATTSHLAARHAIALAEATGAVVHFVTAVVRDEVSVIPMGSDEFVFDTIESARVAGERFVESLGTDVEFTVEAMDGSPAKALLEVAERVGADLIVVGNVRMQGVGRVLGSVGNDVLHSAPCNVLIVKTV
jgi:nucleotide-binding universal stress UspA family protein